MHTLQDPPVPDPDVVPRPAPPWPADLAGAILRTLVYADLFQYSLTVAEIAHYLIGAGARPDEVAPVLDTDPALAGALGTRDGFYFLRGREALVDLRTARARAAAGLWRRAARYSRLLRHFPFVRMIAVTGALAMDNVAGHADIDLLVVSTPGRVWICRRLLVLAVHGIRLLGDELCPNFILAADSLALAQQDLFTAHELAQMRPLAGYALYTEMFARNPWVRTLLPNVQPWPAAHGAPERRSLAQRLGEWLLRPRRLDRWEQWEMERLRRKLAAPASPDAEVACTASQCKGHTGYYRAQVLRRYEARLHTLLDQANPSGGGAAQAVAQGQAQASGGGRPSQDQVGTGLVEVA